MRYRIFPFILVFILWGCVEELGQYSESDSSLQSYLDLGFEVSLDNNYDKIEVSSLEEAKNLILEFEKQSKIIYEDEFGCVDLLPKTRGIYSTNFAHIRCAHEGYDEILDFSYLVDKSGDEPLYECIEKGVAYDLLPKLPMVGTYNARVRSVTQTKSGLYISTYLQKAFTVQPPGGVPPMTYYDTEILYWTFILENRGVYFARGSMEYPRIKGDGKDFDSEEEEGIWVPRSFE